MQKRLVPVSFLACVGLGLSLPAQKQAPSLVPSGLAPSTTKAVPTTEDEIAGAFMAASEPWQHFLNATGGDWASQWCRATGTPRAIWGSGVPLVDWRENSLGEARRHANQLLADQAELLGLGTSEFREIIGAQMGRTWSFVYDQFFAGLPVIGGRADVRVHMVGRVPMFGSTAWPIPANFNTTPALGSEVATAVAWQALGQNPTGVSQPAPTPAPRLVVWGDVLATQLAPVFLAWEVAVSNLDQNGVGPIGRYYVDARTGGVLHYTSDKHECGVAGCTHSHHGTHAEVAGPVAPLPLPVNTTITVMGWTRTGNDAYSALVNVPLPGLQLTVPGVGAVTTNNSGQFTVNIAAATMITVGALDGRHHAVILGANAPSGSFTINPGVASTIQLLTAGSTFNQGAHTTTTWWTDRVNEFCRSILGNSAQLNTADNVVPTVNIAQNCNAFYNNNTINFYQAGSGCSNTASSTVIAHEWGHGLDDRYGGISQIEGLSEGWGDIIGMYLVDSPVLGSGFQTAGVGLRDGNNTRQYPPPSEVHDAGEVWMGFAWRLRDRLAATLGNRPAAIALTNTIVIGTIVADATDQPNAVREVFIADDDDGNLANGTPHSVDLIWACDQHSLPYPGQPGLANDDCAGAIPLSNGVNGTFSNGTAMTSAPAWPCASGGKDVWFTYSTAAAGSLTVDLCGQAAFDTALQIFSGSCASLTSIGCNDDSCGLQSSLTVPVTPGTYYIRVGGYNSAGGTFSLNVNGPGGGMPATSAPYGAGCYHTSKAFYEYFATSPTFDLSGTNMRLVKNPGNFYIAQAAGAYVPPTGAATSLVLGDDAEVSVTLSGSFPFIGGTTSSLQVCSNGFVSTGVGNGVAWTPTAVDWLGGTLPRWGLWHDFNPSAVGSGAVKFQQIGSIAYVTWDGVYSYNTTDPNTWQLQFDLTTGNVTYAVSSVLSTGGAWLAGYAAAAPNEDAGSLDISVALPGTFRTSAQNMQPLALAGTLPHLGGTVTLTATNYPANSALGLHVVSLVQHNPGIDLTVIGMGGCYAFTDLESLNVAFPVGGQSTYGLSIPNNPVLQGLLLTSQAFAFSSGANAFGLVASNGVAMTLGL